MRGITAITLLTFAAQAKAEEVVDRVLDRVFKAERPGQADLDSTALGKAAQLGSATSRVLDTQIYGSLAPLKAPRSLPGVRAQPFYTAGDYVTPPVQATNPTGGRIEALNQAAAMPARGAVRGMATARAVSTMSLEGKVALVTGASRGIGEAIAAELSAAGATVVGTATSDSGAEKINAREGIAAGMKLDVSDQEDVDKIVKAMNDQYGGVDILINNAGITKDGLMMMMKQDAWDSVISTNLGSVFKMTKGVLRGMTKKKWGRVISISSVVGSMGNGGQTNYAAAKAGMDGFTRALAREVASRGVTVNSVAPGFIKSDMTDQLKDEWKDKLLESVPVGRLGTPKEVADAVLYLSSPMADYVTGQTLHVNGGMYM